MKIKPRKKSSDIIQKKKVFAEERFYDNPTRLMTALGIRNARMRGYCCPNCSSGTGSRGTGMELFLTNTEIRHPKLKCFACEKCYSAIDLVLEVHPEKKFLEALDYLVKLYTPKDDPVNDRELLYHHRRAYDLPAPSLVVDDRLLKTYEQAILYRQQCPEWQQRVADSLGLPFEALNRNDIGKSFHGNDGTDPNAGDLVTFNLLYGEPVALKVRHTAGVGYDSYLSMLDYNTNAFRFVPTRGQDRAFRQAGTSGALCFGHDSITEDITTVAIVEGQSDVLAVCAAAQECGITSLTAIGRDSASHILKQEDLSALQGKDIIYCQDNDNAGAGHTEENLSLLQQYSDRVRLWTPTINPYKDARAMYNGLGASEFMNNLLNSAI